MYTNTVYRYVKPLKMCLGIRMGAHVVVPNLDIIRMIITIAICFMEISQQQATFNRLGM